MTSIEVKDFGPIAEGAVDLKPLTVFIGPNNSGKSYMALLVYALSRVGAGSAIAGQWGELSRKLLTASIDREAPSRATFGGAAAHSRPPTIRLTDELRRCFGADVQELVRRGEGLGPTSFRLSFPVEVTATDVDLRLRWEVRSKKDELEQADWGDELVLLKRLLQDEGLADDIASTLEVRLPGVILGAFGQPHYLPASRTGILLGHKILASLIVGQASLAWVRPIEIPRLTGGITDFIQSFLLMEPSSKRSGDIRPVVEFLEEKITQGTIDIDWRAEYPEIYFEDATGRYRLNQLSSMLSEMASLVLYLKYVVSTGERLIIEEPEAHLDSGNQRHLASAIAMLVNAGVNVLVTTHSNLLLSEINNLLLASGVDATYTKDDYERSELLTPEQVAAYFFNPADGVSSVEEIEVTREDGISVESFAKVHEALYDEAIRLQYAGT